LAERIAIFPLHTVLLPHTDLGLHVFEQRYRDLVCECLRDEKGFGVVLIRSGREVGGPAEPHTIGTMAKIAGYARLPDGRYLLEVEGASRFRIDAVVTNGTYPSAHVDWLPEPIGNFATARRASAAVETLFRNYRLRNGDGDLAVSLPVDPVSRSYVVASLLQVDPHEKQRLLETETAAQRLEAELKILRREIALIDHLEAKRG
jgi:Lon protease-like protein